MSEANNNFDLPFILQADKQTGTTNNIAPATYSKETIQTSVDTFLGQLQSAINSQILSNTKLPIIESHLSNGQQIINNFRDDLTRELKWKMLQQF